MEDERRTISLGFSDQKFHEGQHICYIYNNDDERLEIMAKYLKSGMEAKEKLLYLVQHRNPGPLGQVRVQRLCHLYDSMLLKDQVVPTTYDQGVTNEPISETNTYNLALPISYCMGTKISLPGIK